MKLTATISKLLLGIVVACLTTGCQPDATDMPASVAKNSGRPTREPVENIAKKGDSKETSSTAAVSKDSVVPENSSANHPASESTEPAVVNDPAFHEDLVAAANEYLEYGIVNSLALAAPVDCEPASDGNQAQPLMSQSDDQSTHGSKLYFLFAKEVVHYLNQDGSPSPVGQVLVKESWTSKPSNPNARNLRNHASGNRINPRTKVGDELLEIGKRKDLFLMLKLAPETPGTDQGWVYGIVNPESKVVMESGKVSSCIQCHQDAKHDRLFGPSLSSL